MSDLRERLAAALTNPGNCEHPGRESCDPWWRADAALPVVAEWLREEADELRRPAPGRMPEGDTIRRIEANALDVQAQRLADSLTRKEPTP